jgi:hypothetical protein
MRPAGGGHGLTVRICTRPSGNPVIAASEGNLVNTVPVTDSKAARGAAPAGTSPQWESPIDQRRAIGCRCGPTLAGSVPRSESNERTGRRRKAIHAPTHVARLIPILPRSETLASTDR